MLLDDRYLLGPQIGRGGMAAVHAATDTKLHRRVAVKMFHPGGDEVTLARLQAEARLLAGLSHPGLLRVFDVCLTGERPYLVLELINGTTLRTLINKGRLEPRLVARLGARLAETLQYVHSRDIVHRDIKPSNVLLDNAGDCYLADFGIARVAGAARLTRSGQCVGTAAYLAPEQVAGDRTGPAVDIYALGLVLLECLTGRLEYTGTEVEAALARLTRSPHVPHWLPPDLRRTLIAMTARDPDDRPDAETCAQRFDEAFTGLSAAAAPARPPLTEPTHLSAAPKPSHPALAPLTDLSAAREDQTKPWDLPPADPSPMRPERPARRQAWLRVSARAAVAVALAGGIGLATLLPSETAGSSPPAQPAAPPAQSGGTPPTVVEVAPRTAVGHVIAPAAAEVEVEAERQPATGETKKDTKKGRQDGDKGKGGGDDKGDDDKGDDD